MKKIFTLVLMVLLCVGLVATVGAADGTTWDGATVATAFAGGTGTEDDPYRIETAGQMIYFRNQVNNGIKYIGQYIRLEKDLDMNSKAFGAPIGYSSTTYFAGTFDGNHKTISNLTINLNSTYYKSTALFGYVGTTGTPGTLKNLTLSDISITHNNASNYAAALCACFMSGTIENCHVTSGKIITTNKNGVGGIVGCAPGTDARTIKNCSNGASVSAVAKVAGIIGSAATSITEIKILDCMNTGKVSATKNGNNSYAAGIFGGIVPGKATIERCANEGEIEGTGFYVGGIAASNGANTINNCYNSGKISGAKNVGGIAGSTSAQKYIKNSHNVGVITASQNIYTGGITGYFDGGSNASNAHTNFILNCYYLEGTSDYGAYVYGGKEEKLETKTQEEFADKTVYDLLQDEKVNSTQVWGQTIGTDDYPVFYNGSNEPVVPHTCDWKYSLDADKENTIIAICNMKQCDGGSVSIVAPTNLIYTGSAIEAVVTNNLKTGDTVTVEYTGNNLADGKSVVPGSYTAKIELGGKEISVDYEITKATLSVSGEATASGIYGATLDELTLNASGLTVTPNVAGTWTLNVDHGNYIAIFMPNENAGCYETLTTPVKLNLANKSVTAVITVVDKMYDGTATAEVTASVAASDLVSDDSIIISGLTGTFADINVGEDIVVTVVSSGVSITGTGAENYNVTIPTTATASISKKPLAITANAQSIAFGGSISQTEYTRSDLATGDTLESVTLTATGTDSVGTGTITPSAATIMRGTDVVTANYDITYVDGVLSVGKQTIGNISIAVTAPVQGEVPQSSVDSGTGYTGEISWSPAVNDGKFGFDTAYTVTVTLTPGSNYTFDNATAIPDGFSKTLNADGTLTLTKTFDKTRMPNLTKLKTELGNTLSVYCADATEAIALLPKQMTFETEVGDLALDVVWSCDSYNSEVGKTNIFAWTALNAWEAVKDSYNQNDVPLSSTVNLTNAQAIPITITGVAAAQDLVYDGTVKQGYTGTPTSAEYAGSFTITYTGTEADGSSYGPTSGLPIDAGAYIVTIAVPATGTAYSGQTQISFSIAKAVPTGEPVSTPIYRDGKTLADAGLTTDGGTFSVDGTVTWNDPLTTVVEEGKAYEWTFMPTDSGNYEPITGSVVVYPVGDAPVISEPAEVQTISMEPGSTATMTVSAQGTGGLAYQWYISYDGGKTFEAINGATQPSYTTSAVTTENNGYQYYCLVTNLYGETKSPVFTLSVLEPAALPQTGDNSRLALWLALLGMAGAAMFMLRKRAQN